MPEPSGPIEEVFEQVVQVPGGFIAGLVLFPLFDWRKPSRSPGLFAYEDIS